MIGLSGARIHREVQGSPRDFVERAIGFDARR